MKKVLMSLICFGALFANSNDEIEKLKQENIILKQRLDNLENRFNHPLASFFDDFDSMYERHLQTMQKLNEIIQKELSYAEQNANLNKNFSSFFKSGDVISQVKQKIVKNDSENTTKTEFKTYNVKNEKEYKLSDVIKDFDTFSVYLKSKFPELSEIKFDNFYISNDGFTFSTKDLIEKAKLSFDDVKNYLKDDFLKDLGF